MRICYRPERAKFYLFLVTVWFLFAGHGNLLATIAGLADVSAEPTQAAFYVATDGTTGGDGSLASPWDLATALAHPAAVQPGDTIWLRGGAYSGIFTSHLAGTAEAPIVVRSYPGEWAVIDTQSQSGDGDAFIVHGSWTHYRDFELMNSRTNDRGEGGFVFAGSSEGNKFINLIVHDLGNNTFRDGNEIYGSLLYNNGADGSFQQHQLYAQNDDPNKPVRLVDSILFNGFAFGLHAYAGGVGQLRGIHLVGNVWFNNGAAQTIGDRKDDVLIGGINGTENILLQENMGWAFGPVERSVSLGRYSDLNEDIALADNYLAGDTSFYNTWQSVAMSDNIFYAMSPGNGANFDPTAFAGNTYLANRPTGARVFVRPNQYEPGRAHVVVYNWDLATTVAVDVSSVLLPGNAYEVRNAQNYFAAPVVSGAYDGNPIELPMTGLEPAQPIGPGLIDPTEYTGPEFNVFVLITTADNTSKTYLPLIQE